MSGNAVPKYKVMFGKQTKQLSLWEPPPPATLLGNENPLEAKTM